MGLTKTVQHQNYLRPIPKKSSNLQQYQQFIAPLTSSLIGSTIDTFLFFSISFYATGIPWVTLSLGDLAVKVLVALVMLIPFRLLLGTFKAVKA